MLYRHYLVWLYKNTLGGSSFSLYFKWGNGTKGIKGGFLQGHGQIRGEVGSFIPQFGSCRITPSSAHTVLCVRTCFSWRIALLRFSSLITSSSFGRYNSVVFSIFAKLSDLHVYIIPERFHHPPHPMSLAVTLHPPPPSLLQPISTVSLWTCLFWAFHINGIVQHVASRVWRSSLSVTFSSTQQRRRFTPFQGGAIFPCVDSLHFLYPAVSWWICGLFLLFWDIVNGAAVTFVCKFLCEDMFSILLGI